MQMVDKSIRKYAAKNFGDGYYPFYPTGTKKIQLFGLMRTKKSSRKKWKSDLAPLAGLQKYVVKGEAHDEFIESKNAKMIKDDRLVQDDDEDNHEASR